jgi:hypothetical protein
MEEDQATPKRPVVHLGIITRQGRLFPAVLGEDDHLFFYGPVPACACWLRLEVEAGMVKEMSGQVTTQAP